MIGMPEVNNLMNNEMVIHHVLGSFSTFEQQFNTDRVEPLELNPELAVEDDDDVSTTPEPGLWLSYMQKRSGKVPDFILTDGADVREGTIGEYLYITTWLSLQERWDKEANFSENRIWPSKSRMSSTKINPADYGKPV